jgi:hypothetical protein
MGRSDVDRYVVQSYSAWNDRWIDGVETNSLPAARMRAGRYRRTYGGRVRVWDREAETVVWSGPEEA